MKLSAQLAFILCLSAAAPTPAGAASVPDLKREVQPLLEKYCFDCHGFGGDEGGLALDQLLPMAPSEQRQEKWLAVWRNLRAQTMPPAGESQPTVAERQQMIVWIERSVLGLDPDNPDPGRVTLRRLNRTEYQYTIQDLLGVEFNANETFPADDTGYGFDTIGDVLSLSPLLMEKYLEAAQAIMAQALPRDKVQNGPAYARFFPEKAPPEDAARREQYAREILRRFAGRAFRRPVDEPTLDRLVALTHSASTEAEVSFEQGIAHAMTAVLVSPRFLFRAETQPSPDDPAKIVDLDDYALAARLSYFLWSSLPDDTLFRLARQGKLRAELPQQVKRMLQDPKSQRFVENFVGQWLQTRDVETVNINAKQVLQVSSAEANKVFNREVRRAMRLETEMLFAQLLRENGSASELLDADYTYLNEALAKFYGVPGVKGNEMRKVALPANVPRGGLLTHGSFLVVTSNPTRTSPVKRGLFLLENVLGTPPPPAPPDVPELEEAAKAVGKGATMREVLAVHREDPACASCHARMDPLGLALENFNALGQYRGAENGKPIDSSGQLVTGEKFANVKELSRVLASGRKRDFYRCLAEKMLTFALGRGLEYYDAPTVDEIVAAMEQDQGRMQTLVQAIVASRPFLQRRGDG